MSKIIFVSNRLPVTVKRNGGNLEYQKSIGGLATGLKSYHEQSDSIWVGWPGISEENILDKEKEHIQKELRREYKCLPVFLSDIEIDEYYNEFCNKTIWPLFHYFTGRTKYNVNTWKSYQQVNEKFFRSVEDVISENDIIWIHDYQLMLLPKMIKDKYPETKVGFFLHIPFPSYEIFRLLIWRDEILKGLLGADLVGFHTYEYARHFISCTRRLLGLESNMNQIYYEDRYVQVNAFPMGIDFEFFSKEHDNSSVHEETKQILEYETGVKNILSIDRLDYTKGIPERLRAYSRFLSRNPEYREKVRLNLIVAPSREDVDLYDDLRREIKELVSEINGKYATFTWMPIWFFYRSFSQESLIAMYRHSDVLLVTPLRDGMNLIAKEYLAARTDCEGMLVLSETAGAASELGEAVIVNANDYDAIANGIKTALDMHRYEKIARSKMMQNRIKRYNVEFWASEFLQALKQTAIKSPQTVFQWSIEKESYQLNLAYQKAQKRVLFLDYDGTLVGFHVIPEQAKPDKELIKLLADLANDPQNTVVLISGRERDKLADWFGDLNVHIIASHGLWIRHPGQDDWIMTMSLENDWKESIRQILESYTDRTPGSFIEEKEYSLAWHYRQCEPDMVALKLGEIRETFLSMMRSTTLGLQEGNKVLEVKDIRVNKGFCISTFFLNRDYDFIFAVGDDYTDEDIFTVLSRETFTFKIGWGNTAANYHLKSWQSVRQILKKFTDISNCSLL